MVDIVSKIAAGELTFESGRQILLTAFPIEEAVVDKILTGAKNVVPSKPSGKDAA